MEMNVNNRQHSPTGCPQGQERPTRRRVLGNLGFAVSASLIGVHSSSPSSLLANADTDRLVRFGDTDLYVTRYCQGTAFREIPRTDNPQARSILHRCLDVGINFFDSAEAYGWGGSETVLGKAIRGHRDEVILCTKASPNNPPQRDPNPNKFKVGDGLSFSQKALFRKVEGSLRRLGTDYLDLYLLHDWDNKTPPEQLATWMGTLVQSGKIRYWGISNFTTQQVNEFCDQRQKQFPMSGTEDYFHIASGERPDADFLNVIHKNGLGLLAFSPQNEGQLSPGREDKLGKAKQAVVRVLDQVARNIGATRPQVCIAWVLAHQAVTTVLGGAESPEHVTENFGGTQIELPPEAISLLDAASEKYRQHRLLRIQQVKEAG